MFDDLGSKIVDECKGLPIAIVAVGRSLKGKRIEVWGSALFKLKTFQPLNIEPGLISPYACLELSFDSLPNSIAKSLFLLCSMFPEDHEIHKEDLIRFGKRTLGLDEAIVQTMEDARIEILAALEILIDSCLLMSIDKQACVKMHDLVRDVALWITKKQGQAFLVDSDVDPNMLISSHQSSKDTKALSLWNLDYDFELSNELRCPTLEILLLQPHGFIEDLGAIEALKVLALITNSFEWNDYWRQNFCSISPSIVSLTNLHTLCLRGKELGDISFFVELKGLEILDLRHSAFNGLPAGIAGMKKLRLLDVFGCEIQKSPLEVIGRCEQLEELYFWDRKSPAILENFSRSRLKRYAIYDSTCNFSGDDMPFLECFDACIEALRALCIQGLTVSTLESSIKDLIFRANLLWLENCRWNHKDISFDIKHFGVSRCPQKRFIVDNLSNNILQSGQVFFHLITLTVIEMNSLEQVFQDSSIRYSLPMLQELCIRRCPELTTIFNHATVTSLPKLRKLDIGDCNKVKWLFSYSHCPSLEELRIRNCSELERLIDGEAAHGDRLLHQREPLHDMQDYPSENEVETAFMVVTAKSSDHLRDHKLLTIFQSLKVVNIVRSVRRKKYLFEVVQVGGRVAAQEEPLKLNLELCSLLLYSLEELEYIWKGPTQSLRLHKLEFIALRRCPKLSNIFTPAVVTSLPELKSLDVSHCEEWKGIFCEESLKNIYFCSNVCFPKLKNLFLENLPKLKVKEIFGGELECLQHKNENKVVNSELCSLLLQELPELEYIWKGPSQSLSLHRLVSVSLWGYPKLRNIFTLTVVISLPELWTLNVYECEELEGIFCEASLQNLSSSSSIVCFPRLEAIQIYRCDKLRRLFSYSLASHCPSLEKITIQDCSQLEGVVQAYEGEEAIHYEKLFPKLNYLNLDMLPKLREIYPYYEFAHLSGTIQIKDCPNIRNIPLECMTSSDLEIKLES